jgi:hypothetical protein
MWQDSQAAPTYNPAASQSSYYSAQPAEPLQFYDQGPLYDSRDGLQGSVGAQGTMGGSSGAQGFIQQPGPWWTAFGTGGLEGEPPLLEGAWKYARAAMTCAHVRIQNSASTLSTSGPRASRYSTRSRTSTHASWTMRTSRVRSYSVSASQHFCSSCVSYPRHVCAAPTNCTHADSVLCRAPFSLRSRTQSGKPQFGYIYGLAASGSWSIFVLLNCMSPIPLDLYRTASVLGYCILPMVAVGALSVVVQLQYAPHSLYASPC